MAASRVTQDSWSFQVGPDADLFYRLRDLPATLGDVADIFVGIQTSADAVFIMDLVEELPTTFRLQSKSLDAVVELEREYVHPIVSGTDVSKYKRLPHRQFVLFPYHVKGPRQVELVAWSKLREKCPHTAEYLELNRKTLEARERGKAKGPEWFGYIYRKNMYRQQQPKLCVPRLVESLYGTFDATGDHYLDNVDVGGLCLKDDVTGVDLIYLLGVINSSLMRWYFPYVSAPFRGSWWSANKQFLSQLPMTTDGRGAGMTSLQIQIRDLAATLLELHGRTGSMRESHQRTVVERQIAGVSSQLDGLVFEEYQLSSDDVQLVERCIVQQTMSE